MTGMLNSAASTHCTIKESLVLARRIYASATDELQKAEAALLVEKLSLAQTMMLGVLTEASSERE